MGAFFKWMIFYTIQSVSTTLEEECYKQYRTLGMKVWILARVLLIGQNFTYSEFQLPHQQQRWRDICPDFITSLFRGSNEVMLGKMFDSLGSVILQFSEFGSSLLFRRIKYTHCLLKFPCSSTTSHQERSHQSCSRGKLCVTLVHCNSGDSAHRAFAYLPTPLEAVQVNGFFS